MGAGGLHKLLAEFDGIPLVRRSASEALHTQAASVNVVTGHRHLEIIAALEGLTSNARTMPVEWRDCSSPRDSQ